jgi:hypothetical protein
MFALPTDGSWGKTVPPACELGPLLSERALLRPASNTFYARDALNPDVVRVGNRYLLYFSGNNQASDAGRWRTGLAVSVSPRGPFRVEHGLSLPFLNGGTVYDGRHFFQGATASTSFRPTLYRSRDGRRWHRVAVVPEPPPPAWDRSRSDLYLVRQPLGLDIYYAGRPGPSGADIGRLRYRSGRFRGAGEVVLERQPGTWDGLDLGEPAIFQARGRTYMVYTGQATRFRRAALVSPICPAGASGAVRVRLSSLRSATRRTRSTPSRSSREVAYISTSAAAKDRVWAAT